MNRLGKLIPLGEVLRTHGYWGELVLDFPEGNHPSFPFPEFIFFEMDGGPVPFWVEKVWGRKDQPILKLEDVISEKQAREFLGKTAYRPVSEGRQVPQTPEGILGFMVEDQNAGPLGRIISHQTLSGKPLLEIGNKDGNFEIPGEAPILVKIDFDLKRVDVNLPEGFLEVLGPGAQNKPGKAVEKKRKKG